MNIIPFDKWGGGKILIVSVVLNTYTTKSCSILEVLLINNNKISDLLFVEFSLSMHSIETLVSRGCASRSPEASETQLGRVKAICDLARLASGIIVVI